MCQEKSNIFRELILREMRWLSWGNLIIFSLLIELFSQIIKYFMERNRQGCKIFKVLAYGSIFSLDHNFPYSNSKGVLSLLKYFVFSIGIYWGEGLLI